MKAFLLMTGFVLCVFIAASQTRYFTKSGRIVFQSKAPLEDIEAINKSVTAVLETTTGKLQFAINMRGFEFHKALMQQHFNESYIESHKYPKSTFSGTITSNSPIDFSTNGVYPAEASGDLTIHGVTKQVKIPGTITVDNGKLQLNSTFNVAVADYNISIPALVKEKIAKTVQVMVNCQLEELKGSR